MGTNRDFNCKYYVQIFKKRSEEFADGKSIPVGRSHKLMEVKILRNKKVLKMDLRVKFA